MNPWPIPPPLRMDLHDPLRRSHLGSEIRLSRMPQDRVWRGGWCPGYSPKSQRHTRSPFLLPPQLEVAHFNRNFQARCDPIIFAKTGGEFTALQQVAV